MGFMTFIAALSGTVLRAVALLALAWGTAALVNTVSGDGPNIGAGLAAFGITAAAAALGGAIDGRLRGWRSAAAVWLGTAVLVGVGSVAVAQLGDGGQIDGSYLSYYLAALLPVEFTLVAGSAAVGIALGALSRPGHHRPGDHPMAAPQPVD